MTFVPKGTRQNADDQDDRDHEDHDQHDDDDDQNHENHQHRKGTMKPQAAHLDPQQKRRLGCNGHEAKLGNSHPAPSPPG